MMIPWRWIIRISKREVVHLSLPNPNKPYGVQNQGYTKHPNERVHQLQNRLYATPHHCRHSFLTKKKKMAQKNNGNNSDEWLQNNGDIGLKGSTSFGQCLCVSETQGSRWKIKLINKSSDGKSRWIHSEQLLSHLAQVKNDIIILKFKFITICIFLSWKFAPLMLWCSGYHVSLTHWRSPVRSWAASLIMVCIFFFFKCLFM